MLGGARAADGFDRYLGEISRVSLLGPAAELALARELRVADRLWRRRALSHPCIGREILVRWRRELALGRQPTALSSGYSSSGAAERVPRVRAAFERAEALLDELRGARARPAERLRVELRSALLDVEILPGVLAAAQSAVREGVPAAARAERLAVRDVAGWLAHAEALHGRWLEARSQLASANLRLVVHLAKNFRGSSLPMEDLVQEGNAGLLRAVEKFDYRRGVRFSSYAGYWIKQAMLRAQRYRGRFVRLPSCAEDRLPRLRQLLADAELRTGRSLDPGQIAEALGLDPDTQQDVVFALQTPSSLDASVGESDEGSLAMTLEDPDAASGLEYAIAREARKQIRALLRGLPARQRRVIRRRFGTDGKPPGTLVEIGRELGVSRERVRQIEREALEKLRAAAGARDLDALLH